MITAKPPKPQQELFIRMLGLALLLHASVVAWDYYAGTISIYEKWEMGFGLYTLIAIACIRWNVFSYKVVLLLLLLLVALRWTCSWYLSDPLNHYRNYTSAILYSPLLVGFICVSGLSGFFALAYALVLGIGPFFGALARFEGSVFTYPLASPVFAACLLLIGYFMREWKNYEQRLARIEEFSESKTRFFASMSHEIRTPMTAVMSFSELILRDRELNSETRDRVVKIRAASRSLLGIIDDVLDMSKLEAGKLKIKAVDFQPMILSEEIFEDFSPQLAKGGGPKIALQREFAEDFPQDMRGDVLRIRQVLVNLIGNAIKFTESGTVVLQGSRQRTSDGADCVKFEVIDTGIGIDSEVLPYLFDDYTQADQSIGKAFSGTGLGLSISKQLVELMGGSIGVSSVMGQGSCFWFTVPFEAAHESGAREWRRGRQPVEIGEVSRSLRVALAEDNELLREAFGVMIRDLGHQVYEAADGVELLEVLANELFDLVITDIRMPGMPGTDAVRRIRRMDSAMGNIPVVALTADAVKENVETYRAAGVDCILLKPCSREQLARAINEVMGENIHEIDAQNLEPSDGGANVPECPGGSPEGVGLPDPIFEIGAATEKIGLDEETVVELLCDFVSDYADIGERIRSVLITDPEQAGFMLHSLRGLAANLCMDEVLNDALKLENALPHQNRPEIDACYARLARSLRQTIEVIKKETPSQNS